MIEVQPLPSIDVVLDSPSPFEQGLAIGRTLQSQILCAETIISDFETFRLQQPWWMPFYLFQYLAQWRARSLLEPRLNEVYPQSTQRLKGIAEGAGIATEFLYLFHALESASTAATDLEPAIAACSALVARGEHTANGQTLLAHNFDLVHATSPLLTIRESRVPKTLSYIALSLAPMVGVIDGLNEAGLAITYNYAPTTNICADGPPISVGIERALTTCSSVDQAVRQLSSTPRGGGALLMLADASGAIAALELSADYCEVRQPASDWLSHSNAYQSQGMRKHELPRATVYGDKAPEALRGQLMFESAEKRQDRMTFLMRKSNSLDVDGLAELMSDHGPDGAPTGDSICMHGPHWSTLASVQLIPTERRMRVSYGHTCAAHFRDFAL